MKLLSDIWNWHIAALLMTKTLLVEDPDDMVGAPVNIHISVLKLFKMQFDR